MFFARREQATLREGGVQTLLDIMKVFGLKIQARSYTLIFEVKISAYEVNSWGQPSGHESLHRFLR